MSVPTTKLSKFIKAVDIMRRIREVAFEQYDELSPGDVGSDNTQRMLDFLSDQLTELFPEAVRQSNLVRHIRFNQRNDYYDIMVNDLPSIERAIIKEADKAEDSKNYDFDKLLHPTVREKALPLYHDGHFRQSILEAYVCVLSLLRERAGIDLDGDKLVTQALSLQNPILVIRDMETETGKNIQRGMMMILQGVVSAFRNPAAHPHDIGNVTSKVAAQHLIMASLLYRRVEKAKKPQ